MSGLQAVRCRVCGRLLFKADGLARVEIVCPEHRGDPAHRRPQCFTVAAPLASVKRPC